MNRAHAFILATAFIEGASVLVIEIAGARAVAPFYGTSLTVWTSQITATLLFLALGYGLGGKWSRREGAWQLPAMFWGAGLWLAIFAFLRVPVLTMAARLPGVGLGSFVAGSLFFGVPLACLGAVSPLLIRRLETGGQAGEAAGSVFLVNTLGGLAGGWATALLLIPRLPLRVSLAGTGAVLAALGGLWAWRGLKRLAPGAAALLLAAILGLAAPRPARSLHQPFEANVLHSHATQVGLLQVLDIDGRGLSLLLDGITQGGMDRESGLTLYEFTEYQSYFSHLYHPAAKRALLLGLGTGLLAKQLSVRGLEVDVAELEGEVEKAARRWFGLPAAVRVHLQDARVFLRQTDESYDLIFLDAFAGENVPWYLVTREAMELVKSRLKPGGRMVVNYVTQVNGSLGLQRVEAALMAAFGELKVYVEAGKEGRELVNACLVAGQGLRTSRAPYKGAALEHVQRSVLGLEGRVRDGKAGAVVPEDGFSDLDNADAELRTEWRKLVLKTLGPALLGD